MTKFCHTPVHIPALGRDLIVDGNSKIGGYPDPKPNAFSLPAPATCPGSTPACRSSCYASWEGTKMPPELRARYEANETAILEILEQPSAGYDAAIQFARWIATNCQDIGFRWHVSGDVFADQYAWWIVTVALTSPEVQHWIYTRTLRAVGILKRAPNLAVNVSADRDNFRDAALAAYGHGVRLTYLWKGETIPELPEGSVIFPDYPQRQANGGQMPAHFRHRRMICGEDYFGQSKSLRCGVCTKCGNPRHPKIQSPSDATPPGLSGARYAGPLGRKA